MRVVAGNQIGEAGAQAVAEALRSGECGLTELDLDGAMWRGCCCCVCGSLGRGVGD